MKCFTCDNKKMLESFKILEGKFWHIEIHLNQCHLGRCVIVLNTHFENFTDLSDEQVSELWVFIKKIEKTIKKSFNCDLVNYTVLGNIDKHLHVHVVPRYSSPKTFSGVTFTDERFGKNYAPYDKNFQVTNGVKQKIVKKLKTNL